MRTIIIEIAEGAVSSAERAREIRAALEEAAATGRGEVRLRVRHERTSLLVQLELATPSDVLFEELSLPDSVEPRHIRDRVAAVLRYWDAVRYWKTVGGSKPAVTGRSDDPSE
jgi:hypothetical protein